MCAERSTSPGLISGTSSEYLGKVPLRRLLIERPVVLVVGPRGSGRTSVAKRVVGSRHAPVHCLDTQAIEQLFAAVIRSGGRWPTEIVEAPALVLDGVGYLRTRRKSADLLLELIHRRVTQTKKTAICMLLDDPTTDVLMKDVSPGSLVTVMLRFPTSRSGKMRFAKRLCDQLGIDRSAAVGTDALVPWSYGQVKSALLDWQQAQSSDA